MVCGCGGGGGGTDDDGCVCVKAFDGSGVRSSDGSFLFSPSSTAFALMHTKNDNCLRYLSRAVEKVNGGGLLKFYLQEKRFLTLEYAKKFSSKFLRKKQVRNELLDKWLITMDLPGEVGYALDMPWYASLPRVETRFYLEQ
ncbi:terpenoid cyclases/Protein prenyltransferases superfamily protein [Actinidia rufa]|uniref:Terpenoid cyclases/Protein prenyltransferases superfamily protein n=1 Tax=Actinidia rufa TaxID=165716 RepID=A0A7J0HAC9_9ERIC|nr:terpenoid cyclases/Protein prenyltransferases superfamily protein [Actinidia rufa]